MHGSRSLSDSLQKVFLLVGLCLQISPAFAEQTSVLSDRATAVSMGSSLNQTAHTFMAANEAFKFDVLANGTQLDLIWIIAPNYYLYRHAFELSYQNGDHKSGASERPLTDQMSINNGLKTHDDYFGPVEVYYHQATASIERSVLVEINAKSNPAKNGYLLIKYQGCADAGLCYPVQTHQIPLEKVLLYPL